MLWLKKNKNPSSPRESKAEVKIRTQPQIPPTLMNILPLPLYTSHNWSAKETQGSNLRYLSESTCSPIDSLLLLHKSSLHLLELSVSSVNSFLNETRTSILVSLGTGSKSILSLRWVDPLKVAWLNFDASKFKSSSLIYSTLVFSSISLKWEIRG